MPPLQLTAEQRKLYKLSSVAASQPAGQGRYVEMMTAGTDVKDTSVIDSLTGDMWSYQQGTDGTPSGTGPVTKHYSPTAAQFAAMPTDPTALRAALIAQWDAQNKPGPNPSHLPPEPIAFYASDRLAVLTGMLVARRAIPGARDACPGTTAMTAAAVASADPAAVSDATRRWWRRCSRRGSAAR
jgi:hypothetical protein